MFGFEKALSTLWLGCCYAVFAVTVFLSRELAEPLQSPPVPYFAESRILAHAALVSEPVPSWEVVSVPVAVTRAVEEATEYRVSLDSELHKGVKLLDTESSVRFLAGSNRTAVRLMVDWRQVRQLVTLPLQLDKLSELSPPLSTRCDVKLFPLPMIRGHLASDTFHEARDEQITVTCEMDTEFPQAVNVRVRLICDEDIARCIPVRDQIVTFAPHQTLATAVFEVLDNKLATGDRLVRVSASSDCTRIGVSGRSMTLTYNDDERVYNVELLTVGLATIDEDDPDGGSRTLRAVLSEPCGPEGLQIPLQIAGTATQGNDYRLSGGAFVFKPSASEATVELVAMDDRLREGRETVSLSLMPGSATRFVGASTTVFNIEDSDPLVVNAELSAVPAYLREGTELSDCELIFTVAEGQTSLASWSEAQRSIKVVFDSGSGSSELDSDIRLVSSDGKVLPNQTVVFSTDGSGSTALLAVDDELVRGMRIGSLNFVTPNYVDVHINEELVVVIEDDDPLPATISIDGVPRSRGDEPPKLLLDESAPQVGAKLVVTLDEPAERDISMGLRIYGKADANDVKLGPSPSLGNGMVARFGEHALKFAKGAKTVSIPIEVIDDDVFESTEDLIFDLVPSLGSRAARLEIYDNDAVILGFEENPLIVREGESAEIVVAVRNAPDGLKSPLSFTLVVDERQQPDKQIRLKTSSLTLPARQRSIKVPLEALADELAEGRRVFKIGLELPPPYAGSSFYQAGPPLDVWVDDPGHEVTHVVVLVVTPSLQRHWNQTREELAKIITHYGPRLAGGGVIMIGADAQPALWKMNSTRLPVAPITDQKSDVVLLSVLTAIDRQLRAGYDSADATVLWDVTESPSNLPSRESRFPNAERLALSLLFYGADGSGQEITALKTVAQRKSSGSRQHRIGTPPDPRSMPVNLLYILRRVAKP